MPRRLLLLARRWYRGSVATGECALLSIDAVTAVSFSSPTETNLKSSQRPPSSRAGCRLGISVVNLIAGAAGASCRLLCLSGVGPILLDEATSHMTLGIRVSLEILTDKFSVPFIWRAVQCVDNDLIWPGLES